VYAAILNIRNPTSDNLGIYKIKNINLDEIIKILNDKKLNCLIDAGAFLVDYKPYDVIKQIIKETEYDYYVYIGISNTKYVIEFPDRTTDKHNKKIYPSDYIYNAEKTFIYYDNKHIVGIDIPQQYTMKGLVTINH